MPTHEFVKYLKTPEEAKEIRDKVKKISPDIVVKLSKNSSPKKIGAYGVKITIPDEILTSKLSMAVEFVLSDY